MRKNNIIRKSKEELKEMREQLYEGLTIEHSKVTHPLTDEEKETIIIYNQKDKMAKVGTYNKGVRTRLLKLYRKCPTLVKVVKLDDMGYADFEIPKKWIKFNSGANPDNSIKEKDDEE